MTVTCSCYCNLRPLSWWERDKAVVKSSQGADLSLILLYRKASALVTPSNLKVSRTPSHLKVGLAAHTHIRA